uniref:Uncharacterized protein n=1 Tax=Arundo donax TaxID=35708 RepID=A0A0A9F9Q3_ARUDO
MAARPAARSRALARELRRGPVWPAQARVPAQGGTRRRTSTSPAACCPADGRVGVTRSRLGAWTASSFEYLAGGVMSGWWPRGHDAE